MERVKAISKGIAKAQMVKWWCVGECSHHICNRRTNCKTRKKLAFLYHFRQLWVSYCKRYDNCLHYGDRWLGPLYPEWVGFYKSFWATLLLCFGWIPAAGDSDRRLGRIRFNIKFLQLVDLAFLEPAGRTEARCPRGTENVWHDGFWCPSTCIGPLRFAHVLSAQR